MKYLLLITVFFATDSFAKHTVSEFTMVLNEGVRSDIKKDSDRYKKKALRAPASIPSKAEPVIEEVPKIDKTVRQIGPNKW